MAQSNTKKYRPSLTACMVDHILHLAKSESPISSESISLIGVLAPFQAKIQNDAITEAYTTAPPKKSVEESLGMVTPTKHLSKEDYWEECHVKYTANPTECSLQEIEAAREHAYLHDLMTIEEKELFESNMLPAHLKIQAD